MAKHALIFSVNKWHFIRNTGSHKIATWLRENDWDVEVIDYAGFWPEDRLIELANSRITSNTVFVGWSDTWGKIPNDIEKFKNLTTHIKNKFPHIKTILGSQNVGNSAIIADYYIEGYAENALLEVIKHILGTNSSPLLYSLFRSGKLIRSSDYPAIYFNNLNVRYEARDFIDPAEQLGFELSRGCKFQCDFCNYFPLGVKGNNFITNESYIDNLKYLNDTFGTTLFYSADSTMNVNHDKLAELGEATARLNFKPWISGFTRADLMISHPESWDAMIAMGYVGHHYGIETFNQAAGKSIGKGMHPSKIKQGLIDIKNYFKDHQYRAAITMIYGLPYESHSEIVSGIDWIYENLPDAHLTMYPLYIDNVSTRSNTVQQSLLTRNPEKYGYVDTNSYDSTNQYGMPMNWKNIQTGTSWDDAISFVKNSDLLNKKLLKRTPWLMGELCHLSGMSFPEALKYESTRNEVYNNYNSNFRLKILEYINNKLNYNV